MSPTLYVRGEEEVATDVSNLWIAKLKVSPKQGHPIAQIAQPHGAKLSSSDLGSDSEPLQGRAEAAGRISLAKVRTNRPCADQTMTSPALEPFGL